MNEISKQVTRARRRLLIGKFFRIFCWSCFAGLLIAAIGLAVPKIWHLSFLGETVSESNWMWSWIGGGCLFGLLTATILTWMGRDSQMTAAVEVDRRFGLKERLSSALSLDENHLDDEAAQALLTDAAEKAQTIDVRDQFGYQPTWKAALPLLPGLVLFALMFVPNAALDQTASAKDAQKIDKEQVKVAVEKAKKKLEKKAKEAPTKGLKDALEDLNALAKKVDKLGDGKSDDKKQSLVKINDIKKQLEDRQKQLGGSEQIKQKFKKLSVR